jgi:hypothetical protein
MKEVSPSDTTLSADGSFLSVQPPGFTGYKDLKCGYDPFFEESKFCVIMKDGAESDPWEADAYEIKF